MNWHEVSDQIFPTTRTKEIDLIKLSFSTAVLYLPLLLPCELTPYQWSIFWAYIFAIVISKYNVSIFNSFFICTSHFKSQKTGAILILTYSMLYKATMCSNQECHFTGWSQFWCSLWLRTSLVNTESRVHQGHHWTT